MQTLTESRPAINYFPSDIQSGFSREEVSILEAVERKVGAADSLDDVMNLVFEATRSICPCDRIGLAFLDEDGKQLKSRWVRARYSPICLAPGFSASISQGSLARVIEQGHPRIINDLGAYLRQHPRSESTRLLVREGAQSSMTCPLKVDGRNVGILFRSSQNPDAYDEHQLALHLAIEERLSQAIEKAYRIEQLGAAKGAFAEILGFVSHELKNALTTVSNDAWALNNGVLGELTAAQKEHVGRIQTKTDLLENLIRQYLDLARLDDDNLEPVLIDGCDFFATVVAPVAEMLRSSREAKRMRLAVVPDNRDLKVTCDPDMLKIVLGNLLGNAIKYGDDGGDIRIRWQETNGTLRVSIFNTGPGFSAEEKSRLFQRFSRLATAEIARKPGTGLGLYNVRRIVELHQGTVHAESDPGRWAEFSFEMPLYPQAPDTNANPSLAETAWLPYPIDEDEPDGADSATRKPRVLLIDDDPDIGDTLALRLGTHGIDVVSSLSGMQGYWKGLESHPDVIITDLVMPDGEGNYVYSRFRGHPLTENTPVIVLTGHSNPAIRRQMLSLGVSAFLTKPIDWAELLEELHRLIDFPKRPLDETTDKPSV